MRTCKSKGEPSGFQACILSVRILTRVSTNTALVLLPVLKPGFTISIATFSASAAVYYKMAAVYYKMAAVYYKMAAVCCKMTAVYCTMVVI